MRKKSISNFGRQVHVIAIESDYNPLGGTEKNEIPSYK